MFCCVNDEGMMMADDPRSSTPIVQSLIHSFLQSFTDDRSILTSHPSFVETGSTTYNTRTAIIDAKIVMARTISSVAVAIATVAAFRAVHAFCPTLPCSSSPSSSIVPRTPWATTTTGTCAAPPLCRRRRRRHATWLAASAGGKKKKRRRRRVAQDPVKPAAAPKVAQSDDEDEDDDEYDEDDLDDDLTLEAAEGVDDTPPPAFEFQPPTTRADTAIPPPDDGACVEKKWEMLL